MTARGGRFAGLAMATLLVTVACGSGTSEIAEAPTTTTPGEPTGTSTTPATGEGAETFSVLAGEGVPVDLDDLAADLEDRLVAAGHADAAVEVTGDRVTVSAGEGPLDRAALEGLVSSPGRLEFRPVLEVLPPDCEVTVPTGANEAVDYPELDAAGAVVACYTVAATGLTNDAIEDAQATSPGPADTWVVNLVLTPTGIDAFNDLARACHAAAPTCPSRLLAIAVDGVVISAPTINEPEFERDLIQISGDFDEADAKALAAALRAEPLPGGLEVVE